MLKRGAERSIGYLWRLGANAGARERKLLGPRGVRILVLLLGLGMFAGAVTVGISFLGFLSAY